MLHRIPGQPPSTAAVLGALILATWLYATWLL